MHQVRTQKSTDSITALNGEGSVSEQGECGRTLFIEDIHFFLLQMNDFAFRTCPKKVSKCTTALQKTF
jgi:hypothetical protein